MTGRVAPDASHYISPTSFNQMAPFMNNTMRQRLQPTGTAYAPDTTDVWTREVRRSNTTAPASDFVLDRSGEARQVRRQQNAERHSAARSAIPPTQQGGAMPMTAPGRRVVTRPGANVARSAAPGMPMTANTARSATTHGGQQAAGQQRRVVARSTRVDNSAWVNYSNQVGSAPHTAGRRFSAEQCLADYSACMDRYCERRNTQYNRCYCSPRLAQIDAQYQPRIREGVRQLTIIREGGPLPGQGMTDAELEEFWEKTFSGAGWGNSMASLNATLAELEAMDMESRVRGQNAFVTGHEFCVQHIVGCSYMAQNMLNVYRSKIARDCSTYENTLHMMTQILESTITQMTGAP